MSYQVLARKWRPRSFREMVGQTHVLKALINALDNQRLHHAYLFTGTRGVGKTTIARILAKCLNCETGVSSTPCGECSVCREIDEGRFVDLIEVDAASRTKVEDTRELLDNVQYSPTRGRYKVYLIDEVHMLSSHSFNALLKTLEEPPPHVKFLLATTDPQKLPVTILSRCLQFSLKNMPPERVVEHLTHVLGAENVPFEDDALWLLGRAADGSMRDAMSLTDQAIAFGEGKVLAADVRAMLGTLDHGQVYGVLQALLEGDARALLEAVRHLAEQGPDWGGVLAEILNVLHRVAIAQALPEAIDNGQGDRERVLALAQALPAFVRNALGNLGQSANKTQALNFPLPSKVLQLFDEDMELESLLRLAAAAISRLQTHQLSSLAQTSTLPDGTQLATWQMEVPMRHQHSVVPLQVKFQEEQRKTGEEARESLWRVELAFDLEPLGPLHAQATLLRGSLSSQLWAERDATARLVEHELGHLRQRLRDAGLTVGEITCQRGRPPQGPRATIEQRWVDETA
ncbi:DNA polymerase III subunit gamma/tau [Pseudomonas aeruginosa]|uniref:DNA polymerase III subunit gamma/tau n=1 Tax=Pseudomonas aeruginosa TaxID=287 RepID=UPI0012662DD1|nr:DNA polymerase III subunit gamma/tau [Pseudomonas aeruginosa]